MTFDEPTPLLDSINLPSDIRHFSFDQLVQLSDELRHETIRTVSLTGGHLGASLGVVELTVAIHHIFDTPNDRLIWDVGHQCYPHKILTGRRKLMNTKGKVVVFLDSLNAQRVNMIHLVLHTHQLQFQLVWEWQLLLSFLRFLEI